MQLMVLPAVPSVPLLNKSKPADDALIHKSAEAEAMSVRADFDGRCELTDEKPEGCKARRL